VRSQSPRVAAGATALLCAALLSCCGKANPTLSPSTATSAGSSRPAATGTSTTASPEAPLTQAQANAYGRAVNLRASDVPGFTPTSRGASGGFGGEKQLEARLVRCAGGALGSSGSSGSGPSEVGSPQFRRRGALLGDSVSSAVSFFDSAAHGAAELKLLRSEHLRMCLSQFLNSLLRGRQFAGATLSKVSIVQGTPPAPGTTGGFGWRVTAIFALRSLHVPFYLDTLGFIDGRSQVTLQSSSAGVPFPAAAEEQLYNLLLERAKTHRL
jgi:hypothetical protein